MRRFKIKIKRRLKEVRSRDSETRILLSEITFASAVNNLGSKKNKKMIRRWVESGTGRVPRIDTISNELLTLGGSGFAREDPLYKYQVALAGGRPDDRTLMPDEAREILPYLQVPADRPLTKREIWDAYPPEIQDRLIDKYVAHFKSWLLDIVPEDIEDNQKGLVVTWLNRLSRDPETGYLNRFLSGDAPAADAWGDIEMFFHYQQFMDEKDLNRIADLSELEQIVLDARDDIKAYQEKRSYADADEGTEVLRADDEFYIAALHNKGAACSLGKGTSWCTAAPGLDYFSDYYKPEDPLFYFENRDPGAALPATFVRIGGPVGPTTDAPRYQFHYGSLQFMDENDDELEPDDMRALHRLLMQTEAPHKYPIVKQYDRKLKIKSDDTSPEELHGLIEDDATHYEELIEIGRHDNISEESLRKLMAISDPLTPDYVGRTGDQRYATALKKTVAIGAKTPEILEELWQITKAGHKQAEEETKERLRKDARNIEQPGWGEDRLPLQLRNVKSFFEHVWKQIAFNKNVSNEVLKEVAEYADNKFMRDFADEKILAREEGFTGEKELRAVQVRGRVVRRQQAARGDPVSPPGWEEGERYPAQRRDLNESKIYAQWKKIIN